MIKAFSLKSSTVTKCAVRLAFGQQLISFIIITTIMKTIMVIEIIQLPLARRRGDLVSSTAFRLHIFAKKKSNIFEPISFS